MATGFPTKANWSAGDLLTASQMDDLAGTVNTLANVPPRNAVLNSNFSVWQRSTSVAVTGNTTTYTADRWACYRNTATANMTVSRQATGDTTNLPNIQYGARIQRTAADTATNTLQLVQMMETVNSVPYAGKSVTVSFYARAGANYSSASNALSFILYSGTGTDQNLFNPGYTGSATPATGTATLTTTWQRFQYTGTIAATATELSTFFSYTPVGTAGTNDYFEITGVQLELGSTASTYYPNQPTYATELAACQRYYWRNTAGADNYGSFTPIGGAVSTTSITITSQPPVSMRSTTATLDYASMSVYGGASGGFGFLSVSNLILQRSTGNMIELSATVAGATAGGFYRLQANNAAGYLGVSCEL